MEASDKVEAVALGSTQNQRILKDALDRVKHHKANANMPYDPLILIAMDNDDAGDMANHQIAQLLKGMHFVGHIVTHALVDNHKDANEALVADKTTAFAYNLISSSGNLTVNFSKEKGLINEIS
ncbi:hypothetical protein E0700_07655 [Lactobacillus helveticus]|nr:toprim domain-containing protein [Lactobacillus helveticus]MBW8038029.1 hypothetical protein [Lactobacillus helveticus]